MLPPGYQTFHAEMSGNGEQDLEKDRPGHYISCGLSGKLEFTRLDVCIKSVSAAYSEDSKPLPG